jgi:2-aminobenzoate-CoA ligase
MPPAARLSPSAHVDTFTRDHLPPAHLWPAIEFTTPELAYPDRLNAATELIDVPAETLGASRPALRTPGGQTWTYGELRAKANQVAQVLTEDLGLVPGQRVLLRSPNNPWTVAAWLGVLKAGGVVVTTMAALRARELAPIAERTQPSVALVDHRFAEDACAVRDTVVPSLTVVAYGGDAQDDLTVRAAAKSGEFSNVATSSAAVATWHCWPRHQAAPGYRRSRCTSTGTSCRSTTRSAATLSGWRRTTLWPAPRRSPSPSASACWSSSRCGRARARC